MARTRVGPKKVKIQIRLDEDDLQTLREFYPVVGYNHVVRVLVRKHCRLIRSKAAEASKLSTEDLDII